MTWEEALETVVEQTGHERYRWLCSEENPDQNQRQKYRDLMIRKATGEPEPSSEDRALRAYISGHPGGCCH